PCVGFLEDVQRAGGQAKPHRQHWIRISLFHSSRSLNASQKIISGYQCQRLDSSSGFYPDFSVSLVEKFLRDLPAVFRELYEDLFVQPNVDFRGVALVAWVFQLSCHLLSGREATVHAD